MEEARKKIEAEMAANAANPAIHLIGKMLLQHLRTNPGAASAILAKDKTLKGSYDAMRDEARKHHNHGGGAVLTDEEGFNMVLNYFGITMPTSAHHSPSRRTAIDVDLDDLLGGL